MPYIPNFGNLFGFGNREDPTAGGKEWARLAGLGMLNDLGYDPFGLFDNSDPRQQAAMNAIGAETAAREAARQQAEAFARQGIGAIQDSLGQATGAAEAGTAAGLASMEGGYNAAASQLAQSGAAGIGATQGYYGQGIGALGQGFGAARGAVAGMGPAYNALGQAGLSDISGAGLAAGYQRSPGYNFALQQAQQGVLAQAAAAGGRGGGNTLRTLSDVGQQMQAQDWGQYVNRAMQAKQMQLGALETQGSAMDAAARARAGGMAQAFAQGGQSLAGIYGQAAEAYARQQQALGAGLAGIRQQYGSQALGAQQATGTQLANLYGTTGANIAAALTGQGQLGANLATGIDRSSLVATAGGAGQAIQGGMQDLAKLGILYGMGR